MTPTVQTWEVWYPDVAATGLLIARARIDPTDVLWLHAASEHLAVTVREADDRVTGRGEPLQRVGPHLPMTRLTLRDGLVTREDRWPVAADHGALVLLPGGEVGRLLSWWNAPDGSEWRWSVELYNHR